MDIQYVALLAQIWCRIRSHTKKLQAQQSPVTLVPKSNWATSLFPPQLENCLRRGCFLSILVPCWCWFEYRGLISEECSSESLSQSGFYSSFQLLSSLGLLQRGRGRISQTYTICSVTKRVWWGHARLTHMHCFLTGVLQITYSNMFLIGFQGRNWSGCLKVACGGNSWSGGEGEGEQRTAGC